MYQDLQPIYLKQLNFSTRWCNITDSVNQDVRSSCVVTILFLCCSSHSVSSRGIRNLPYHQVITLRSSLTQDSQDGRSALTTALQTEQPTSQCDQAESPACPVHIVSLCILCARAETINWSYPDERSWGHSRMFLLNNSSPVFIQRLSIMPPRACLFILVLLALLSNTSLVLAVLRRTTPVSSEKAVRFQLSTREGEECHCIFFKLK